MAAGIPSAVRENTVAFRFNQLDEAQALFAAHPGRIACVILEAATAVEPHAGYLEGLRRLCSAEGALRCTSGRNDRRADQTADVDDSSGSSADSGRSSASPYRSR